MLEHAPPVAFAAAPLPAPCASVSYPGALPSQLPSRVHQSIGNMSSPALCVAPIKHSNGSAASLPWRGLLCGRRLEFRLRRPRLLLIHLQRRLDRRHARAAYRFRDARRVLGIPRSHRAGVDRARRGQRLEQVRRLRIGPGAEVVAALRRRGRGSRTPRPAASARSAAGLRNASQRSNSLTRCWRADSRRG